MCCALCGTAGVAVLLLIMAVYMVLNQRGFGSEYLQINRWGGAVADEIAHLPINRLRRRG
jgi:hypothetical protein